MQDEVSWWMDLRASRHVCKERHLFKTYSKVVDGEALYMGNNSSIKVQGKGQVELVFTSGNILILHVYYAPKISRNLVSGLTLNRLGYKLVFESDRCIISKNSIYVGRCYLINNLFKLCLRQSCDSLILNIMDIVIKITILIYYSRILWSKTSKRFKSHVES